MKWGQSQRVNYTRRDQIFNLTDSNRFNCFTIPSTWLAQCPHGNCAIQVECALCTYLNHLALVLMIQIYRTTVTASSCHHSYHTIAFLMQVQPYVQLHHTCPLVHEAHRLIVQDASSLLYDGFLRRQR